LSPAEKLLPLLRRVKRTGPGRWIASCPTREDKSPSLAVRELDDGTLLLHDFGGDDVVSIVAAVGLSLADLFPKRAANGGEGRKPERRPFSANDLIDLAAFEALVVVVVIGDIINGKTDADLDRLLMAADRLGDVAEATHAPR